MALFKPYWATSESDLASLPIKEGQIIFLTDDKSTYLDLSDEQRVKVSPENLVVNSNYNATTNPVATVADVPEVTCTYWSTIQPMS